MAILNVTPDSFYAASRVMTETEVVDAARRAVADGADILDVGACSTRPGSEPVSENEEWMRLEPALRALRTAVPQVQLSVDTFRPEIARRALEQFGNMIINDISGGCDAMYQQVRDFHVPYIWTLRGDYSLLEHIDRMEGISLILDPGLGFTGGVDSDYQCLRQIDRLSGYGWPVLIGVSRKSMLYRLLETTPDDCLSATQVLHLFALQHGATILRVHDVRPAKETLRLYEKLHE